MYKNPGPRTNVTNLLPSVIYDFSYYARVFVRLGWNSLPGTNTLAYYKNKRSFIIMDPDVIKPFWM